MLRAIALALLVVAVFGSPESTSKVKSAADFGLPHRLPEGGGKASSS